MKKIIINGKEYSSLNDLPGLLQDVMKDQNKNGIPDIAEDAIKNATTDGTSTTKSSKFVINGREYNSWDEIPETDKNELEQKFKNAQKTNQNINIHQLMSTFGGLAGYGISKLLKLPGSQGEPDNKTNQAPKKPADPTRNEEAHRETQMHSRTPKAIKLNSPKPGDLPGVKGNEGTRLVLFAAAIIAIIGWMIFEFGK